MAAQMFSNQKAITPENLTRWAEELGINGAAFSECVASDLARDAIANDIRKAQSLQLSSTPTFFINGRRFEGLITTDTIEWLLAHPEKLQ
jgi:protein-disulfide isomerase